MRDNLLIQRHLDFKRDEDFDRDAPRYSYEVVVFNRLVRENLNDPFPRKLPWSDEWASNQYFVVRNSALMEDAIRKLAKARFPEHQGFVVVDVYRLPETD